MLPRSHKIRYPNVDTLVLLQDNDPENSGRRTQFLNRMVSFADRYQLNIRLAYYPPYHGKYNPVERCCGVLENHWNGALLDTLKAIVGYPKSMTGKKQRPVVRLVTKTYQLGVNLSKQAMKDVEHRLDRLSQLPAGFIDINWHPAA
ncbi:MAG: hypothetical protein GY811_07400 [Myxococcales bacterium]|nr:hypothetical protein [Myxococcales bacterium]